MANIVLSGRAALILRVIIGALFGVIIAILIPNDNNLDSKEHILPHNWDAILAITLYVTAFIIWAGAGVMRRINLGIWFAISFILVGYIAIHAIGFDEKDVAFRNGMVLWLFPLMFIINELVVAADVAGKPIAPYETYFDEAWKRGVQLIFALIFTGLMWAILFLGSALLKVIGFDWLKKLLEEQLFFIPVSGIAMGVAVHLGDVQPKLLANVRNLALNILSWLLIVITLVGLIFVISLFFSGLKPLWDTKSATAYLLLACVFLVLLINAAFGSGEETGKISKILKVSIRIGSVLLLVISAIATYGLWLRINQYGLTSERILAAVAVIIALSYGVLYCASNFSKAGFMAGVAGANIYLAIFKCVVFIGLLTPILDPNRLSVNSQVGRLIAGKITPEKFDWEYLKFHSGKYGLRALDKLEKNPKFATMATAIKAKTVESRYDDFSKIDAQEIKPDAVNFVILDNGKTFPPTFTNQGFDNRNNLLPGCMTYSKESSEPDDKCYVRFLDLDGDGADEIISVYRGNVNIFHYDGKKWGISILGGPFSADDLLAFKNGKITIKKPKWNDVQIGDNTLRVQE